MNYYDFDEWYYQELDRSIRRPVYKKRTRLYALLGGGSARSLWFAGAKPRALHRTRTGDPFLTMQREANRLRRRIFMGLAVFWLSVGLLIVTIVGGLDA